MSDASRAPMATVTDIVDDGLSEEEIAVRSAAWLSDLGAAPIERFTETAAESLDRLHTAGEL